jgi:Fe2+ or Zn2+ uptake regulation protein
MPTIDLTDDELAAITALLKRRLAAEAVTREAIAAQLKIGVASVYRVLRAANAESGSRPRC